MRSGEQQQGAMAGRLFVCATPIGDIEDASPRLRDVLASVDAVACEDTRRTRRLLSALGIPAPRLLAHHDHNEADSAAGLVTLLQEGSDLALVSDAGTPAIADPGGLLVSAARAAGIEIVVVPGPTAVAAALSVAGVSASRYRFVGFLPRSASELRALLHETSDDVVVAFESPARIVESLARLAAVQPERPTMVVRELTKLHEQTLSGAAQEVAASAAVDPPRGEIVLVLDALPRGGAPAVDQRTLDLVRALVEEGVRMKTACRLVAGYSGVPQRELYDAAVHGLSQ